MPSRWSLTTKANQEPLTAIKGKGLQVPSSRTDMHKAMMEKFQQQDAGKDFDRAYLAQMGQDHKAAVELFEQTIQSKLAD